MGYPNREEVLKIWKNLAVYFFPDKRYAPSRDWITILHYKDQTTNKAILFKSVTKSCIEQITNQ